MKTLDLKYEGCEKSLESDQRVREAEICERDTTSHLRETVQKKERGWPYLFLEFMFSQRYKLLSVPLIEGVGISKED